MCGINGFNFENQDLIFKMLDATNHRGPDQSGFFFDESISLGHTRLSIIDLSEDGKQPMFNENNDLCIVFNGEIYNYRELRKKFIEKGYSFKSMTDTEVILKAFMEYGEDCVNHLNGIFAFAIWDRKKKSLFLARDHIGVKPLYYYWDGEKFIFSSEIKAILNHDIPKEMNMEAFSLFFELNYIPGPLSIWKNIFKLPPGSKLFLKDKEMKIEKFWKIKESEFIHSKLQIKHDLQKLMYSSVQGQMISDRPLGVFLSGGIDSTILLALATKFSSNKINTFTVGYKDDYIVEKYHRDSDLARKTALLFDTNHNELLINGKMILDNFEDVVMCMDEPNSNYTQIPTYLLSKFAKQKVSVVLSGDGGDELFGGYEHHFQSKKLRYLSYINKLGSLPEIYLKKKLNVSFKNFGDPLERYLFFWRNKQADLAKVLNSENFTENTSLNFFADKRSDFYRAKDLENEVMRKDIETWLVDESLIKADKTSMAFALEQRVPFLDMNMVEYAQKIPSKFKLNKKTKGKSILIETFKSIIPEHVLNVEKMGWLPPAAKWLRNDLRGLAYDILSPANLDARLFNKSEVTKMLNDHMDGKKYNLTLLWSLIVFNIWQKKYQPNIKIHK